MKKLILSVIALLIFLNLLYSQDKKVKPPSARDSIIVYDSPSDFRLVDTVGFKKAWGIDLSVANNGFAFGTFYKYNL